MSSHPVEPVVVSALLELGADVNAVDNNGFTPLHHSVKANHHPRDKVVKMVKLLLENGADVNARDNDGKTALVTYLRKRVRPVHQVISVLKFVFETRR